VDRFKIKVACRIVGDGLRIGFHFDSGLYDEARIRRMSCQFHALLEDALRSPKALIADMGVSATQTGLCLHSMFEGQTARTPDAIAVVCEGEHLDYASLNARANRIAHHIRSLGVRPGSLVAICAERSTEIAAALLGVLKTGAGYVPLDASYPAERLKL